jgi:F-type H+-transporting ATPase subunit epsilon
VSVFSLTLVTPEKMIVKKAPLVEITLPAHKGELNILSGHAPLTTILKAGRLSYRLVDGESSEFVIAWGYCQVTEKEVLLLAENLRAKEDLDIKTITQNLSALDHKMGTETLDDEEYEKLQKQVEDLRSQEFFLKA